MKEQIEDLIESYNRKVEQLKRIKGLDELANVRLKTKAGSYRTFITELRRILIYGK